MRCQRFEVNGTPPIEGWVTGAAKLATNIAASGRCTSISWDWNGHVTLEGIPALITELDERVRERARERAFDRLKQREKLLRESDEAMWRALQKMSAPATVTLAREYGTNKFNPDALVKLVINATRPIYDRYGETCTEEEEPPRRTTFWRSMLLKSPP